MWNLASKNIKEIWRDKKLLTVSLVFPVLLLLVSHFLLNRSNYFTQNIPLAVVNPEPDFPKAGKLLVIALKRAVSSKTENPLFQIEQVNSGKALELFRQGEVAGVLLIPREFTQKLHSGKKQKLSFIVNTTDPRAGVLTASLTSIVDHFGALVDQSLEANSKKPVVLNTIKQGEETRTPEHEALANVSLFAFLFLIPALAGQWVSEIERGSFLRFRLARVSPLTLLSGSFASTLLLSLLQAGVLLLAASLMGMRVPLFSLWIWPLACLFALASLGISLTLSSLADKEKQLQLFSSLALFPLYLFSGPFGNTLIGEKWSFLLPWRGGYSALTEVLNFHSPGWLSLAKMTFSSFVLACAGTAFFTMKRLRHG